MSSLEGWEACAGITEVILELIHAKNLDSIKTETARVAKLKLKGIGGRAPPGVEPVA